MSANRFNFRVWDTTEKQMIYSTERNSSWMGLVFSAGPEWIIMQSTGLLDKNGKEIFEGDIINDVSNYAPLIVEWSKNLAKFWFVYPNGAGDWDVFFHKDHPGKLIYSEVIGNIYENPELLKK